MKWVLVLTALLGLACGGATTQRPVARPGEPRPGVERPTFAPGTTVYRIASHLQVEQEVGGVPQNSDLSLVYYLTARLSPGEMGSLQAALVVDSITRYEGSAAVTPDVNRAIGTVFTGRLTRTGTLEEFQGGDSTIPFVREISSEIRRFFPSLPEAGLRPGERWVDSLEQQSSSSGIPLTIRSVAHYQVGEPMVYGDGPVTPVISEVSYTFSGKGQQVGQEFQVEGAGRRYTREFMTQDGRYLGQVAADSSNFTITVSAAGITIPGRQTRSDTVSVVR